MEGKLPLILVILAILPIFQESSKGIEPEIRKKIGINYELTPRISLPGDPVFSPPDFPRKKPVFLKTDYRSMNDPKLIVPQQEEPLVDHPPISINSNADFANLDFPGAGTPSDPYSIESLNITSSGGDLIVISDTTVYFQIRNNYINGLGEAGWGIVFYNVIHGTIENNVVINNTADGIGLYFSTYNTVANNIISNNGLDGIRLESSSDNNLVVNNTVYNNNEDGIWLGNFSNNNTISHNHIYNNARGILLSTDQGPPPTGSDDNIITSNIIYRNNIGISLEDDSERNQLINNTIYRNFEGISLRDSGNNVVFNNTIIEQNAHGIRIFPNTTKCLLWLNILGTNSAGNAYDAVGNNYWDNGAIGNYWDDYNGEDKDPQDWIGDSPYPIAGGAGAQDRFPLIGLPSSDPFPPRLNQPRDIAYEKNVKGNTVTWHAIDINPDAFILWHNRIAIKNGTWQAGQLSFKIDSLPVGVHNFTLGVNDTVGNWAFDAVRVMVTNPKIAASSFIIMIAIGTATLSIGTLGALQGFSGRKASQRLDLVQHLAKINSQLQQLQETVNQLLPPTTLQELGEISQDIYSQFEKCKAAISRSRLAATQKWLSLFMKPDLAPLEKLARSLNETYTRFTQQYLKWVEELMDD
ncbi:MAG: nitrous oxide reductase family maturation protein NosD [Candidatus Hodarchaeota archaeon]